MSDASDARSFETQLEIHAPRELVWRAIASDEGLRNWFAPQASVDLRVGGEVVWTWGEHHRWAQRIEVLEPGARLRTRYDSAVDDGSGGKRPLFVDFLLSGTGGSTTLRLVQSGFGSETGFDEEYDGISRGWPVELQSLKLYCEQHAGRQRSVAWSSLDLDLPADEVWERMTGERGLGCGSDAAKLRPGDPVEFTSAAGDSFVGTALTCQPRELTAVLSSHGRGFLRLSVEEWAGQRHVWCWLAGYDDGAGDLAALQVRWDAMLADLFASDRTATPRPGAPA